MCRIEGDPPTPKHGSLANLSSQPQQTHCFSLRAAKYLIALTDVGLFIQCRLRGRSKEREEDISKNKSNPESQGEG